MNKATGGDAIPTELFQNLKDDAVKVLQSICQQISAMATGLEKASFIPVPKKGSVKDCSNYHTISLISHAIKVMLKILQARLQHGEDNGNPFQYSCLENLMEREAW